MHQDTMRFGSIAKVLLKCKLKFYRISECRSCQLIPASTFFSSEATDKQMEGRESEGGLSGTAERGRAGEGGDWTEEKHTAKYASK